MAEIAVYCQDCGLEEYDHHFDAADNGDIVCICGSENVVMSWLKHRCCGCQLTPVRKAFSMCNSCRDNREKEIQGLSLRGLLSLPSCGNVAASPL